MKKGLVIILIAACLSVLMAAKGPPPKWLMCPVCKQEIRDNDFVALWYKDGKMVEIHGKHLVDRYTRRYVPLEQKRAK